MIRKRLLRLGHPVAVAALLEALVADTNERDYDDRPRPILLKYLAADGRKLPTWVNSGCGEAGLIVSDEPCPEFAKGTLLLWLRFVPVPRRGRVDDAGLYHGWVAVHLWQAPEYPLSKREVNWFVAHHCDARNNTWWHLTRGWQTLCDDTRRVEPDPAELPRPYIVLGRTPTPEPPLDQEPGQQPDQDLGQTPTQDGAKDTAQDGPAAAQPPGERPSGSPGAADAPEQSAPLASPRRKVRPGLGTGKARTPWNEKLMVTMRQVPTEELYNFDPFFPGWLKDYIDGAGKPPRYPEDTFKQAATSCAERIIRERAARAA